MHIDTLQARVRLMYKTNISSPQGTVVAQLYAEVCEQTAGMSLSSAIVNVRRYLEIPSEDTYLRSNLSD